MIEISRRSMPGRSTDMVGLTGRSMSGRFVLAIVMGSIILRQNNSYILI